MVKCGCSAPKEIALFQMNYNYSKYNISTHTLCAVCIDRNRSFITINANGRNQSIGPVQNIYLKLSNAWRERMRDKEWEKTKTRKIFQQDAKRKQNNRSKKRNINSEKTENSNSTYRLTQSSSKRKSTVLKRYTFYTYAHTNTPSCYICVCMEMVKLNGPVRMMQDNTMKKWTEQNKIKENKIANEQKE